MAHPKMKAITMPFKEVKVDEEGNPVFDKKTGELSYRIVYRRVRHNLRDDCYHFNDHYYLYLFKREAKVSVSYYTE